MLIVMKFGGSSLASAAHIRRAAELILQQRKQNNQVVVVVSAQGDTTDDLIARAREITSAPDAREKDVLMSTGEQMSMALMAMQLRELGCPAVSLCGWQADIRTDTRHGNAKIMAVGADRLLRELSDEKVIIVAGFQGIDENGDITTIGRGGSDTTAVALAAALKADVCRIYTDVRGVYSADPHVVEQAVVHRDISYDEMLEMATLGAQVLHNRAVQLAKEQQVRIEVLSSFEPGSGGTYVSGESGGRQIVRGVTCDDSVAMVTVAGIETGLATSRLFTLLAESGVSIDVIIRSPGTIERRGVVSFSVGEDDVGKATAALKACQRELAFNCFITEEGMAKVSVVGAGMADGCGVAAKMLRALQEGGVEPRYITTGEIRISVIVPLDQSQLAVRLIHHAFFGD